MPRVGTLAETKRDNSSLLVHFSIHARGLFMIHTCQPFRSESVHIRVYIVRMRDERLQISTHPGAMKSLVMNKELSL